jgi:hypothetical protein
MAKILPKIGSCWTRPDDIGGNVVKIIEHGGAICRHDLLTGSIEPLEYWIWDLCAPALTIKITPYVRKDQDWKVWDLGEAD